MDAKKHLSMQAGTGHTARPFSAGKEEAGHGLRRNVQTVALAVIGIIGLWALGCLVFGMVECGGLVALVKEWFAAVRGAF